ncbi:MAG: hypothetical protein ACOYB1_18380 [Limnohabitans sp.]
MSYKVYSGTGTVYMAPVNASGVKTGDFIQVGDAYPLSVQVATKQTEVKSRMVERAGQVIASKTEIDKVSGKLTLREWNAANLAWAVSGTKTLQTTAGATVTDEVWAAPAIGEFKAVASDRRTLTAVAVKHTSGTPTYTVDVDYTLDAKLGLIAPKAGGAITLAQSLKVSYTYATLANYQVNVGSSVQIRVAILAHLYDEYRGVDYVMEIDSAVLAASKEINFISEAGSEGEPLEFDMTLETLSGASSPMRLNGIPA